MFDVKFILVLIPLVVLLFLAYNEISDVKKNVKQLTLELKNQTSSITQNVSQCVERIEKISQSHISELQTINKMNLQQINRVNCIRVDGEDESEGLSSNYMSPNEKDNKEIPNNCIPDQLGSDPIEHTNVACSGDIPEKSKSFGGATEIVTHSKITKDGTTTCVKQQDTSDQKIRLLCQAQSTEDPEIPIYVPHEIQDVQEDSEESESDNDTSEFVEEPLNKPDNTPEHIISINDIEHFAGLVGMGEIFGDSKNKLHNSGPVIESIHSEEDEHTQSIEQISNNDTCSQNIDVSAHIDEVSNKISQHSSHDSENNHELAHSHEEYPENPTVAHQTESESQPSNHSEEPVNKIVPKLNSIDKYTLKELQEIAKQKNIAISAKVDGKMRQYRKQELYDVLSNHA